MRTPVALVDDHALLRNGLAGLVRDLGYEVVAEANNGQQFIEKFKTHTLPHIVLMDVNMPVMNGFETTLWLKKHYPSVKVLALTMLDDEESIIRMLRNGAKGYILKDSEPDDLRVAIESLLQKGFYYTESISGKIISGLNQLDDITSTPQKSIQLTDKDIHFLELACTDLSYKDIAKEMNLSVRTVEGYRDALQEKLECKGRIALVLWAIKNGVVKL